MVCSEVAGRSTGVDFEIYRWGRENPDRFHLRSAVPRKLKTNKKKFQI